MQICVSSPLRFAFLKRKEIKELISELRKKYIGLEVANMLGAILSPESVENTTKCNICKFFPKLKEKIEAEMQYPGTIKITVIRETRVQEEAK